MVKLTYSGGSYSIAIGDVPLDAYGDWFDPQQIPVSGIHYMRYISCRVEGYADPGVENQALLHTDHRHYYAPLGVFLQREPVIVKVGLNYPSPNFRLLSNARNTYRYSDNNPAISKDSNGLLSQNCIDRINECLVGNKATGEPGLQKCGSDCYIKEHEAIIELIHCFHVNNTRYKEDKNFLNKQLQRYNFLLALVLIACALTALAGYLTANPFWVLAAALCFLIAIISFIISKQNIDNQLKEKEKKRDDCNRMIVCWLKREMVARDNCLISCQNKFCNCLGSDCTECVPENGELVFLDPKLILMQGCDKINCCIKSWTPSTQTCEDPRTQCCSGEMSWEKVIWELGHF
ncbi:MAG: hypothetical protein ABIC40_08345 [bacterium]